MSDDFFDRFAVEPRERNPIRAAQREMLRPLARRFYREPTLAETAEGFALTLDGKTARTPLRNALVLPNCAAGDAVVAEWAAQTTHIDPASMPMTRIVNSALDGVASEMASVRAEIVKFAGSDLVCYRAEGPSALVELEAAAWDPLLAWARAALGADFVVARGVAFERQPDAAVAVVSQAIGAVRRPIALACLHTMTTLMGSALLALAVAERFRSADEAWAAAHVDEDFQARAWGADEEAAKRRAGRWREMAAAARLYAALEGE